MSESSQKEFRLWIPTYYGHAFPNGEMPDFDNPLLPVLIREADGVRLILGAHDWNDMQAPDIVVERRPAGWAIFLHPVGGGDPSGYVYFLDDGRSFVQPENPYAGTPPIEMLASEDELTDVDTIERH